MAPRGFAIAVLALLLSCAPEVEIEEAEGETIQVQCEAPIELDDCPAPPGPCLVSSRVAGECVAMLADGMPCDGGTCSAGRCE